MTFTPNIPTTGQSLGVTKNPINGNFTAINTTISQDHVAMNDANQGKHQWSTYVNQASPPTTASNETLVYSKTINGATRTVIRQAGGTTDRQIDGPVVINNTTPFAGESMILGGIILKWGVVTVGTGSTSFTYAGLGLSNFLTQCFGVHLTRNGGNTGASVTVSTFNNNGFTANSSTSQTYFFTAIGN